MSRFATSFVLGFHGCDRESAEQFLNGEAKLAPGPEPYHWLGSGVYFWEGDPLRALEWAEAKTRRGACRDPYVIGAIVDLGNCLDLQARENVELLSSAYASFVEIQRKADLPLPRNRTAKHDRSDAKVLRYLDHAVIDHLVTTAEVDGAVFDTVRGVFIEGDPAYEGAGLFSQTHIQIAVRNVSCIRGVFRPIPYPRSE